MCKELGRAELCSQVSEGLATYRFLLLDSQPGATPYFKASALPQIVGLALSEDFTDSSYLPHHLHFQVSARVKELSCVDGISWTLARRSHQPAANSTI